MTAEIIDFMAFKYRRFVDVMVRGISRGKIDMDEVEKAIQELTARKENGQPPERS